MKIKMADLQFVTARAAQTIINFPRGGKLPVMDRPLTEGEVRVLAIMEATLAMSKPTLELEIVVPDSDSIND